MTSAICGIAGRRQPGLVVEDPAEVVAVGEHLRLERQERPAAVDEVDARQPVLERDLLGPEVLLDRDRVVRAALDRGVVGDDHAGRPLDPADPGDDPGARRLVVVHAPGGERAQLEEGRPRVEEPVDPLADRELAALAVTGDRRLVAAGAASRHRRLAVAELGHQRGHRIRRSPGHRRSTGRAGCGGRAWPDDTQPPAGPAAPGSGLEALSEPGFAPSAATVASAPATRQPVASTIQPLTSGDTHCSGSAGGLGPQQEDQDHAPEPDGQPGQPGDGGPGERCSAQGEERPWRRLRAHRPARGGGHRPHRRRARRANAMPSPTGRRGRQPRTSAQRLVEASDGGTGSRRPARGPGRRAASRG